MWVAFSVVRKVVDWNFGTRIAKCICGVLRLRVSVSAYTGCPRRNVPDLGRVFLRSYYTDITQNTYVKSWTVTEIMAREV